jgi:FtsP/CotA-like multicopper oxidase with cupredoxin domain
MSLPRARPSRRLRVAAGLGLAVACTGAVGLVASGAAVGDAQPFRVQMDFRPISGQPLRQPPVVNARAGVTSVDLTARTSRVGVAGTAAIANVFDATQPSPTLKVSPGQLLKIKLRNQNPYGEPTNLHTHGLHVSPKNPGDNVFVNLPTGGEKQYSYPIPEDHIPGLHWYHPHRHHYTQTQVAAGQGGAIIVKGGLDDLPSIRPLRDRIMIYQSIEYDAQGRPFRTPSSSNPANQLQMINGQLNPIIDIRPGETQRWRLMNLSSDRFLSLRLDGHVMFMLADDGNTFAKPKRVQNMFFGPGERREVLVRASTRPGRYRLRALHFEQVRAQPDYSGPAQTIGTMVVNGRRAALRPIPAELYPSEDLRGRKIARKRTITYTESTSGPEFFINGKLFDPDRIDQTMKLGTVEEWTILNQTDEWHTFHIHVNPFQVVKLNGKPVPDVQWNDDIVVPPYGGSVTMRTEFKDFTGKFVIHCHVLFHEDNGMMQAVQVVK